VAAHLQQSRGSLAGREGLCHVEDGGHGRLVADENMPLRPGVESDLATGRDHLFQRVSPRDLGGPARAGTAAVQHHLYVESAVRRVISPYRVPAVDQAALQGDADHQILARSEVKAFQGFPLKFDAPHRPGQIFDLGYDQIQLPLCRHRQGLDYRLGILGQNQLR
jgi:hypothetical protein